MNNETVTETILLPERGMKVTEKVIASPDGSKTFKRTIETSFDGGTQLWNW